MNNDKLLFVSLYLVVLIFFVIINIASYNPELKAQLIPLIRPLEHLTTELDHKHEQTILVYSTELKKYLPVEASFNVITKNIIFNKDFSWQEVFEGPNLKESFKDFLKTYNKYNQKNFRPEIEVDIINDFTKLNILSTQYLALLNFIASQPKALMFKLNLVNITDKLPRVTVKLIGSS